MDTVDPGASREAGRIRLGKVPTSNYCGKVLPIAPPKKHWKSIILINQDVAYIEVFYVSIFVSVYCTKLWHYTKCGKADKVTSTWWTVKISSRVQRNCTRAFSFALQVYQVHKLGWHLISMVSCIVLLMPIRRLLRHQPANSKRMQVEPLSDPLGLASPWLIPHLPGEGC